MIPPLPHSFARSTPSRTRRQRRRPSLETLEGRQLMSLGPEFLVNTKTLDAQFGADNASSANGSWVAVWTDWSSVTNFDIRAQRFNATGVKVGPEFVVTASLDWESEPAVAMDAQGNFVVTWTQQT